MAKKQTAAPANPTAELPKLADVPAQTAPAKPAKKAFAYTPVRVIGRGDERLKGDVKQVKFLDRDGRAYHAILEKEWAKDERILTRLNPLAEPTPEDIVTAEGVRRGNLRVFFLHGAVGVEGIWHKESAPAGMGTRRKPCWVEYEDGEEPILFK